MCFPLLGEACVEPFGGELSTGDPIGCRPTVVFCDTVAVDAFVDAKDEIWVETIVVDPSAVVGLDSVGRDWSCDRVSGEAIDGE